METYKIKVKIGDYEFEADGDPEVVKAQFADFKELIASIPIRNDTPAVPQPQQIPIISQVSEDVSVPSYDKVFKAEGRVISLTALPGTIPDAILMIVLAQRHYRKNEGVTGSEIMDGLQQSGYSVDRIDRQMDKFVGDGLIIRIGKARGTRYRLTNQGLQRAESITREVISTVP